MTELALDERKLREAATIAHRISKNQTGVNVDLSAAEEIGKLLGSIVGKSLHTFLELEESVRNRLREAAMFVNKNLKEDRSIFGFLQTVCGSLKKCAKVRDTSAFAKIAVFLTALVNTDEAASLKLSLHLS
jgi:hypothetical protein